MRCRSPSPRILGLSATIPPRGKSTRSTYAQTGSLAVGERRFRQYAASYVGGCLICPDGLLEKASALQADPRTFNRGARDRTRTGMPGSPARHFKCLVSTCFTTRALLQSVVPWLLSRNRRRLMFVRRQAGVDASQFGHTCARAQARCFVLTKRRRPDPSCLIPTGHSAHSSPRAGACARLGCTLDRRRCTGIGRAGYC